MTNESNCSRQELIDQNNFQGNIRPNLVFSLPLKNTVTTSEINSSKFNFVQITF